MEHLVQALEHVVQIENLRLEHLLTAEHQELPGEIGGTQRRVLDLLHVAAHRLVWFQVLEQHLSETENDRENVVEVVGHTSSEPPDGFHLLRLAKLFL